ncbi:catalase-peroxidase 3 [Kineosporia sp. NBRC 101677]|nr:catalase/peroxidase HPI [Kineosporia sp. NBRC 101677]GLY18196.1 catalase-peroxidase 3 [Kineosporia sp. NBRC 101677]
MSDSGGAPGGGLGLPSPFERPYSAVLAQATNPNEQNRPLDLSILPKSQPDDFDYPAAFAELDLDALAADVDAVLTTSQDWWPADYGHYGPLIVRMVWHCAGTYRTGDGRGGPSASLQRFAPVDSWPDNRNLDKARRLLWPVKKKYGRRISWADLMVFAGNRALESMGLRTFGYAGGRNEVYVGERVDWGPEQAWMADERHTGVHELDEPLAADQLGLIYVNPEGPNTVPDPLMSARDIRATFRRMGFDDEETVALVGGGHAFGKTHGAADPERYLGPEPATAGMEEQGLGWRGAHGSGKAGDTVTSGLEGAWTQTPTTWDNRYFQNLFQYEWDVALSPAGLWQWVPRGGAGANTVPDPHDPERRHAPTFLTTDLAFRVDPDYEPIARRFLENPEQLSEAFARAWFKLTHIDLGPRERYLGPLVPAEPMIWQDPVPERQHALPSPGELASLKSRVLDSGLTVLQLVATAWASASTFRNSDKRGGTNGGRLRLEPQRNWPANDPDSLGEVLTMLEELRPPEVSMADLIVLGGCAAVQKAAHEAGYDIEVPFTPGRTDASPEWTDPEWFAVLEPVADGFRNYRGKGARHRSERLLIDRAAQLTLTAAEMTVLVGGLRVLGAGRTDLGLFTDRPGVLTNDFFVNLLDLRYEWRESSVKVSAEATFEGIDRQSGVTRWRATRADLVFASNPELRALAELYAADDAPEKFVHDFVAAWVKVMNLGRCAQTACER